MFFKQKDKQLHIAVGFVLTIILYLFLQDLISSMTIVFIVGVGKEIYDFYHPTKHTADAMDLVADTIGILIAGALVWGVV